MIPFVIIRKIFLLIAPFFFSYLLRKMGKREQPKKKSHLSDFDPSTPLRASKERIVEGEIVDKNSNNHY